MGKELFNLKEYGVLVFKSTSQALKAERILKEAVAEFLVIPTPRQISASCGLAVKVTPNDLEATRSILLDKKVDIEGVYRIDSRTGQSRLERIDHD